MTDTLDRFRTEARELDSTYRTQTEAVRRDPALSDTGKRERLERIEAQRKAAVAQLQEGARAAATLRKTEVGKALAKGRADVLQARRALLGDSVLADLYRRRLELLTPTEIERWALEAADGWERAVIVEYGSLELERRTQAAKGAVDVAAVAAARTLVELDAPPAALAGLEREARALADVDGLVLELDGGAYRAHIADTFGVSAANVLY